MSTIRLGKRLGIGKEAEVYEFGDAVLKLYKAGVPKGSAFREAAHLSIVEARGLACPSPLAVERFGERWGIVMTRANGRSFADAIAHEPVHTARILTAMAELHLAIHRQPGTGLGGLKARLAAHIGRAAGLLGEVRQRRLIDELATLPDGDRLCHGDFHPWNILGQPGAATVVDWLDACSGPPAADVCRSYVLMNHPAPDLAAAYVETYAAMAGVSRDEIFAWLPFVAAARLAEGVPQEVDGLMEMVEGS
jgi:Ser/Thr protein kinase RdoA (MazF antagonist)